MSARELSRRMSSLLDEIESEGSALVVIRYGRPAAVLVPFSESSAQPRLPRVADIGTSFSVWDDPDDGHVDVPELSETERDMLMGVARCTRLHWTPSQSEIPARETALVLVELELKGILERGPGASWRLTRKGERLAGLDSEA